MSRNIRILRLRQAPGLRESTPGRNRKVETLVAKTTTTKALLALVLVFSGQSAWSYTVSGNTYMTNGSQSDVQAACSAAPDNGTVTVLIPDGTYTWTGNLSITKSLTLAGQDPTGVVINNQNNTNDLINATSSTNGNINIYYLKIVNLSTVSPGNGYGVACDRTEPSSYTVMVHDCTFDGSHEFAYAMACLANGIILWNDVFIGDGANGLTGINFHCLKYGYTGPGSWNAPDTFGTLDTTGLGNTYVENCTFSDAPSYCMDFEENARVVLRYCTITNSELGTHGQESGVYGARGWEVYNNTFVLTGSGGGPSMNAWFDVRGGTGYVFNNVMPDIPYGKNGIRINIYSITRGMNDGNGGTFCPIQYPAPRQAGWGWSSTSSARFGIGDASNTSVLVGGKSPGAFAPDGTGAILEPIYVWNNTGTETTDPNYVTTFTLTPDSCGNGQTISTYLQQGRDYYVNVAPTRYTPYAYPHPLHTRYALSGGNSTPTPAPTPPAPLAPQNLRVQ
jgi:hypothetical protein